MTPIRVKITNAHSTEVITDTTMNCGCSDFDTIHQLHTQMSKSNPDCFVNFSWEQSFICGQPENMKRDEQLVDEGTMTWDEYSDKWYGRTTESPEDKWLRDVETAAELRWYMN